VLTVSIVRSCSNSYFAAVEARIAEIKEEMENGKQSGSGEGSGKEQAGGALGDGNDYGDNYEGEEGEEDGGEGDGDDEGEASDDAGYYYAANDDAYAVDDDAVQEVLDYAYENEAGEIEIGFCGSRTIYMGWTLVVTSLAGTSVYIATVGYTLLRDFVVAGGRGLPVAGEGAPADEAGGGGRSTRMGSRGGGGCGSGRRTRRRWAAAATTIKHA
jgi:hypothetical protein